MEEFCIDFTKKEVIKMIMQLFKKVEALESRLEKIEEELLLRIKV